ncbi:ArsR/SmtB family transcription factor [Pseudalkalibacillus hwajinpoensis]|uniref:Metalloregulator ArsR/SmtB family transcription factor n=1 Tax=Guptibacillus hwajinpoensis TaxID=208199 RepID=A0A4U1MES8_9BACL|nr:metalloregulator ArsR/SmtB family transcription factor [Pseudalkalibacillus hwajinpoensis]TKD69277.1 metalloregulator ArsR/SmtB family transcription factor [Pseudalkalibacillus hwajinpoensis]
MDSREFKDNVYSEFSRIGKVLSSPKRLELLDLISHSPKSVEALSKATMMSVANTSKHLQALLEARLVTFYKEKNFVFYELTSPTVVSLLLSIKAVGAEQIDEVNTLRNEFIVRSDELETLELSELMERMEQGNHILVDVRPSNEYETAHITGAISMPIHEIEKHIKNLPEDKEVIAYCRGPYCVYATEAVEILKLNGYHAIRLEAGIHEWNQMENHFH